MSCKVCEKEIVDDIIGCCSINCAKIYFKNLEVLNLLTKKKLIQDEIENLENEIKVLKEAGKK